MTDDPGMAKSNVTDWHGKMLIDLNGEKIGKLQDVYVDVETDVPQFATVKERLIGRHLTFVPLGGIQVGPDELRVAVTKEDRCDLHRISRCTVTSSPRQTSQRCITTLSSTTRPSVQRAAAASLVAENADLVAWSVSHRGAGADA